MASIRGLVALAVMGFLAHGAFAQSANYALTTKNTKVEFVGTKKGGSHKGDFKKFSGTATATGTDPATLKLNVIVEADSISADDAKLTAHLKSPDFFEVKKYPQAKFVSTAVSKAKSGYKVSGNLTMHGKTKKLEFPAEITVAPDALKLVAEFKLDRTGWGLSYGKGMIDNDVTISVDVAANKQ